MTAITLTKAAVVKAGRAAYLEDRLSAQGPTPECKYRDRSGCPCVIGAALSDADALRLERNYGGVRITMLVSLGHLATRSPGFLMRLQRAHDDWAQERRLRRDASYAAAAEARLCKLLGLPAPVKP